MPEIDPHILGKLLLIQSTLHVIPDDEGISTFLCRGLADIPGVRAIGICLNGSFNAGNLPPSHTDVFQQSCISCRENLDRFATRIESCIVWGLDPACCIELRTASRLYGFLLVLKKDTDEYSLYEPFLQTTANLVALLLENRLQHAELVGNQENLELLVKERTRELIRSNAQLRKEVQRHQQTTSFLRESEERYSAVMKQASEGIYLLDPETKIVLESNDAFKKMIGYQDTIAPDLFAYDFVAHDRDEIDRTIRKVVSCKTWFVGERKYRHRNGSLFDVEASATLIRFSGKEVLCVIARDITERKRAEEERGRLEERLQQSQKMEAIGTLAGGIAHDFNNILSAIIGYSELVKVDLPPGSGIAHDIDQIVESGLRAADLVKQILAFSRKTDRSLQVIAPSTIIHEVLRMLKATLPVTVRIEEDIDAECGLVQVDPTGLHQIVLNLCTNAFQALRDQKGVIRVRLYRQPGVEGKEVGENDIVEGPAIVLSVTDSGCGMDRETLGRIFEPYFTTKGIGAGTGLGLAVVHGIVHDYKGRISVESEPGVGSIFTVHIPAVTSHPEIPDDFFPGAGDVKASRAVRRRILFVDDEETLCTLSKRLLERQGYTVTTTTDSREALEMVRRQPDLDLVITDQTMPGLTGIELAREILGINSLLPIIMCTGHSDVVSEEDALAAGVKRYVFKPFKKEGFLLAVREVMGEQDKG
jgi:PAS domain S-box-containing protein